jgi:transcriptional/translational regulatory protein YebC/TACO1
MFEKLGQIIIESNSVDEEKLFNDALDSGAEDFTKDESDFLITSKPPLTADIAEKLEHKGYNILSSKIEMVPKNIVDINDSESSKLITLMEQLEEHDDVQNIASNFQINFSNTKQ